MSTAVPKFIIDLDTGVDDAMALLVALHEHKAGNIRILAITTVSGNARNEDVVRNTFRTMEVANCIDIPVFRGADEHLVFKQGLRDFYHGQDGFNDVKFDWTPNVSRLQEETANSAIQRLVRENPREITIVNLAPLTNLALAMKSDPTLAQNLKEIYIMGGNSEGVGNASLAAEFNFHNDPEAAFVVLDCTQCPTFIVPWETCYKYVKPSMEWRKTVLGQLDTPEANLMNKLEQVWFDNYLFDPEHHLMCDQLVMIAAVDPSSITDVKHVKATVELSGHFSRGNMLIEHRVFIVNKEDFRTNVGIVHNMNVEKIQTHLLNAFGARAK